MPSLPPELWAIVLRELTTGSAPHTTDYLDYLNAGDTQASRQAARTAVLVCRTWRRLALPMLYSVLDIGDEAHAERLAHAVAARTDADGIGPRGSFVRQITVREHRSGRARTVREELALCDRVLAIVRRCPRLAVLSYRLWMAPHQTAAVGAVLAAAAGSLRRLEFGLRPVLSAHDTWAALAIALARLPHLATLVFPNLASRWDFGPDDVPALRALPATHMAAPALRALTVPWQTYLVMAHNASHLHFPALREIHISPLSYRRPTEEMWCPVECAALDAHVVSFAVGNSMAWSSDLLRPFFAFLARFPALREVSISAFCVSVPAQPLQHPSLASVILRPARIVGSAEAADAAVRVVISQTVTLLLEGVFPQLREVHVIAQSLSFMRDTRWMDKDIAEQLEKRGITLTLPHEHQ